MLLRVSTYISFVRLYLTGKIFVALLCKTFLIHLQLRNFILYFHVSAMTDVRQGKQRA